MTEVLLLVVSLGWALYWRREAIAKERLPQIIVGVCALAIAMRRPRVHEALAVVNAVAVIVYIGALFAQLR